MILILSIKGVNVSYFNPTSTKIMKLLCVSKLALTLNKLIQLSPNIQSSNGMLLKQLSIQGFGHHVGVFILCADVEHVDLPQSAGHP